MADVVYPHTLVDGPGHVASGAEVMDNFNAAKAKIDPNTAAVAALQAAVATGWAADDLQATLAGLLGVTADGVVRRGKSIIATEEARTNTSYAVLATPDQVANVVVPTDGKLRISYQALWKESVAGAARAAIFLGSNQLKVAQPNSSGGVTTAAGGSGFSTNTYGPLASCSLGLCTCAPVGADSGNATTGQATGIGLENVEIELNGSVALFSDAVAGGECVVMVPAGTYTVSVRFKATSGTVTVKDRRLWVEAIGYGP